VEEPADVVSPVVLAGLGHVENPDGVMFALNQSKSMVLSKEDLAAVETLCHINK
jgi:hypothetical protein